MPNASPSKAPSSGHGHSSSRAASAPSLLNGSSALISAAHWAWQADELLAEVSGSTSSSASSSGRQQQHQVKSLALLAELRLAEALEKAGRVAPVQVDEDGLPLPHKLRTAVCCQVRACCWWGCVLILVVVLRVGAACWRHLPCSGVQAAPAGAAHVDHRRWTRRHLPPGKKPAQQCLDSSIPTCSSPWHNVTPSPSPLKSLLCPHMCITPQLLGEFASLCGPLAGPLATLRQELLPALYSSWCAAAGGLSYEQVPWFEVTARLQRDKEALQEVQEGWRRALAQRQVGGGLTGWCMRISHCWQGTSSGSAAPAGF